MDIKTRIAIRNNFYYKEFLKENSYWYKLLNRNPKNLELMDIEVKRYFKLNFSDKLKEASEKINLISSFINLLN